MLEQLLLNTMSISVLTNEQIDSVRDEILLKDISTQKSDLITILRNNYDASKSKEDDSNANTIYLLKDLDAIVGEIRKDALK